jgi:hypothetical protein
VNAIRLAQEGKVEVVVDDKKDAGIAGQSPQTSREEKEIAPAERLVTQLENLRASTQGGCNQDHETFRLVVGGDDVKAGGAEPIEE